jgi:hypothetical protein
MRRRAWRADQALGLAGTIATVNRVSRSVGVRGVALVLGLSLLGTAGCSLGVSTLGGREKCWPDSPPRAASLWRGILRIDATGGRLATPEGDIIPLLPGALQTRVGAAGTGELVRGDEVVARAGDDVSLFGGAGSDGALVLCAVEEIHSSS